MWARTWRELTAVIPTQAVVKEYTGGERSRWSLCVLGRRITLWNGGGDWEAWDQVTQSRRAVLPGGAALPLSLERETRRAYTTRTAEVDLEAAQNLLEGRLLADLPVREFGEVLSQIVRRSIPTRASMPYKNEAGRGLAEDLLKLL